MKNLRRQFELFCYRNRDKGIPNLMLYIVLGTAVVYVMSQMSGNYFLYNLLVFNRTLILQGQIWRLITYPLTYNISNLLLMAVSLFCYYSLGRVMEQVWGTLRFNLFYFTGVVMMDIWCMIFGGQASVTYLNLSLFLGFATMYPDSQFLLFFIIPVKAWLFALIDLGNYFLFFGKDVLNLIPRSWQAKFKSRGSRKSQPKVIHFDGEKVKKTPDYTHRCTVCGRTDVTNPEMEFRYCSRCHGYYCYCQEHINNHTHIE